MMMMMMMISSETALPTDFLAELGEGKGIRREMGKEGREREKNVEEERGKGRREGEQREENGKGEGKGKRKRRVPTNVLDTRALAGQILLYCKEYSLAFN